METCGCTSPSTLEHSSSEHVLPQRSPSTMMLTELQSELENYENEKHWECLARHADRRQAWWHSFYINKWKCDGELRQCTLACSRPHTGRVLQAWTENSQRDSVALQQHVESGNFRIDCLVHNLGQDMSNVCEKRLLRA
ncbi:hypothetical protein QR680_002953 [Steinernema hermaphroditum]|uniref:Uncharacterized protein n=1 Tax=Steinernema hermaphroditum TaxID=289476 RepID=A0AA39H4S2_9BILA|nr:hypothetical protein QR680_002953 [Steinernema hermaphroditum]